MLLVFGAPCQHSLLAGREHGRTIPLADEGLEVGKAPKVNRGPGAFRTDAYATVAIAYRRAAGIYTEDRDMQELGTAAVHLLTMATSYVKSQAKDLSPSDAG